MDSLLIPTPEAKKALINRFNDDLASFTIVDRRRNCFVPVICCVCDSIPPKSDWATRCDVTVLESLLIDCNMQRSLLEDLYPSSLLAQYSADHCKLKRFVLSPSTYVDSEEDVVICKECFTELKLESAKSNVKRRRRPKQSIANGYVIGDAPVCLTDLSQTELTLISRVRTYCQSWVFFGGCHQHIKGWHTFFPNRATENVGNLSMLSESGLKGLILVVLCGPFTSTQKALVLRKVHVDPRKVVAAWSWLKQNNFRYKNDVIPNVDDIPPPRIIEENK
jgi:hypothetical protein